MPLTPTPAARWRELEAQGFRIGKVRVENLAIFEDGSGEGLPPLYRLANNLHIDTRDSVIESQLLFAEGEPLSERLVDETERNLRELRYIREPEVRAVDCHDGLVDLEVAVREVWTTNPGVSFNRSGGSNAGGIKLEELNLLGRGKQLTFELASDADRTSYTLHWRDPGVRGSRWIHDVAFRDSNDGHGWRVEARAAVLFARHALELRHGAAAGPVGRARLPPWRARRRLRAAHGIRRAAVLAGRTG